MSLQELGHVMMYNNLVPLVRCLKSWTKIKIQKAECLNAMWYLGLDPGTKKGHSWKNW